ncbi:MAG: Minor extracellular protease vpr precursor [Candidatus Heimdallarchaeota archaeon LC_2]|nr:MAG: Minor extracellular protease vpr precursor [Candidatus Heimdallarchaeota archaeon LC_2]
MKIKFLSKKELLAAIVIGVFLLSVFSLGFTALGAKPNSNSSNKTDYAIVEFDGRTRTNTQHANYKAWLHSNAPWAIIAREYNTVLDGMAIKLNGRSMNSLSGPGVKSVTASRLYQPLMSESVPLISADQVWSALGRDPEDFGAFGDIKVGVIDTGIDDTHPFISACRDSVSHKVFFSGTNNLGAPDRVFDHGTHVAGTIGGCYTTGAVQIGGKSLSLANPMSGVAPGVQLHDYNVFPGYGAGFIAFGGSAFSHDIIAAVEEAVKDGMDVINLSLGGPPAGPHDVLAEAINRAVELGTIAVISAGNSGNNLLTVGSPGSAANAITVAAASNAHTAVGTTVSFGGNSLAAAEGDFNTFSPSVSAKTSLTTPIDGCNPIGEDLSDLIAAIDRGECSFSTKIRNAEAQGAVGVIIVNNQPGAAVPMGHDGGVFPTIPAVMLSNADGAILKTHIPGVVTVDSSGLVEIPATPDLIAGFSSIGPTPFDFRQKPDVTAPGVNVLSSVFGGEFAFFQGTSMAAPHVTGAVAVLLAGNPSLTPEQVKSAIVNNADRNDNLEFNTFSGIVYGPLARGGGRLNVMSAFNAEVFAAPASFSLGGHTGGSPFVSSTEFTLENSGNTAISCSVSVTTDRAPFTDFVIDPKNPGAVFLAPWAFSGGAAQFITLSTSSVTLAAGGSSTVSVTFDAGRSLSGTGWSIGDVTADCGTNTLKLPWSLIFQQNSGALNGHAPSGFLMDHEGNILSADFGAAMPSVD